jgi:Family of unknown function (DUF6527)
VERMRRLLGRLIPGRRWHIAIRVPTADQIPAGFPARSTVMVGTRADPRWLAFDCPCGTGHQIMLNLDRRRTPCWTVASTRRLTVGPSIDSRQSGRRCHYFIREGKVTWVPDKGRRDNG